MQSPTYWKSKGGFLLEQLMRVFGTMESLQNNSVSAISLLSVCILVYIKL